jgi:hypothetical protein
VHLVVHLVVHVRWVSITHLLLTVLANLESASRGALAGGDDVDALAVPLNVVPRHEAEEALLLCEPVLERVWLDHKHRLHVQLRLFACRHRQRTWYPAVSGGRCGILWPQKL